MNKKNILNCNVKVRLIFRRIGISNQSDTELVFLTGTVVGLLSITWKTIFNPFPLQPTVLHFLYLCNCFKSIFTRLKEFVLPLPA